MLTEFQICSCGGGGCIETDDNVEDNRHDEMEIDIFRFHKRPFLINQSSIGLSILHKHSNLSSVVISLDSDM